MAVSNFTAAQLDVVIGMGGTKPTVNQLPLSVVNPMPGLLKARTGSSNGCPRAYIHTATEP